MKTHIHIISGFLGAGKTTFLKKMIPNLNGKVALIENEFGEIGVDGDLLEKSLPIKEIYAGCICCTVVQDFKGAIEELISVHQPDHIIIEPSGVGSLSDIIKVSKMIAGKSEAAIEIQHVVTIVDVNAFEDYLENFGSFYRDQIENAKVLFLSHLDQAADSDVEKAISKIREINKRAYISRENWHARDGETIIEVLDALKGLQMEHRENLDMVSADKVFTTVSIRSPKIFSKKELEATFVLLKQIAFGQILRAKGFLSMDTDQGIYFDFTPHHQHWEYINGKTERKLIFIGRNLQREKIIKTFQE